MTAFQSLMGALRGPEARSINSRDLAFLPGALSVIETPPSPTGRALGLIIVSFFTVALLWSILGRVDIFATAPGRLVPAGDVKTIQPLDSGLVRSIRVQDGDHVQAGQVLMELDPTVARADTDRLDRDLTQARLDMARLSALKASIETGRPPILAPLSGLPASALEETAAAVRAQSDQQAAKVADLTHQIGQKTAEIGEVDAQVGKIQATLPMLSQKEQMHRQLYDEGFGTKTRLLDAQLQVSDAKHELEVQRAKGAQASAARTALEKQRDEARSQFAADILSDLRKAERDENELSQELIKAKNKTREAVLRTPIAGVVEQLSIHTIGGVVTPAQHLMIVVPDEQRLMIEAQLANRDVGFVHTGQPVKVKVETFTFTRYGFIDGRVIEVSRDVAEVAPALPQGSPPEKSSELPESPTYTARISVDRSFMKVDGRTEYLRPGMAVTAEIKTGDRSIISYLLSPLARRTQESLHER